MRSALEIPKWIWYKKYFDTGLGLTAYLRYALGFFGLWSLGKQVDMNYLLVLSLCYFCFCFVLGFFWVNMKLADYENEVNNQLNPFQKEVRQKLWSRSRKTIK